MKIKLATAVLAALVLAGAAMESRAALIDFDVDSSKTWLGYMNSAPATGPWGTADLRATFTDSTTLFLQSNVNATDDNGGISATAPWEPGTVTMEANMYQEVVGTIGDTVTFDFFTVADTLTAQGYSAIGFIKVLDGFATWATTQFEWVDLTVGSQENLSLVVADAGAGSEIVQAGFAITGLNDYTGSGIDTLGVTVIPEPASIALVGLAGGAMLFFRRRMKI